MKTRIKHDFYPSPDKLIRAYLAKYPTLIDRHSTILEPCAGEGAISKPLIELRYKVEETDIMDGEEFDASKAKYWEGRSPDWIFTNPPFNLATPIIEHCLDRANIGVIMILRASYLEPCKDRRHLLNDRISRITYCNPRPKFRADSKGSDSTTVVFIEWGKHSVNNVKLEYLVDWNK
jgi:hypothetical protein